MEEPETDAEWQDAADAAKGALALAAARAYGLIEGGPEVNDARCEEFLARAAERGIFPSDDAVEVYTAELVGFGGDPR